MYFREVWSGVQKERGNRKFESGEGTRIELRRISGTWVYLFIPGPFNRNSKERDNEGYQFFCEIKISKT